MIAGIQKPTEVDKLEMNRLRVKRLQLRDSKNLFARQVSLDPKSKFTKLNLINKSIAAVSTEINNLKQRLSIR